MKDIPFVSRARSLRGKLLFYGAIVTLLATPAIALLESYLFGALTWQAFLTKLPPLLLLDAILIAPLWIFLHRSILRPLEWLIAANRLVAGGDPSGRCLPEEVIPDHELGEAIRWRDAMLSRLEELQAQVEAARREEEEAATHLAHSLLSAVTFEEIGALAFPVLRERLAPDGLSLLVVDPSESILELVAAEGWSKEYIGRLQLPLSPHDSSGPARALHKRTPVVEDHTTPSSPLAVPEPVRSAGVQMCVNLPMVSGERCTGVIVLDYLAPRPIGEEELRFASLVSGVVAVAVERALEHRRNRLLFERVPVGLYRSTPEGKLLDVNDAMVRLLGYPDRESLIQTNAVQLYVNPEDRRRWRQLMDREGVVADFEVQWRRYDGGIVWVQETARTIRDASGRPVYYEGSVEDITPRKRFEAEITYLASHDPLTGAFNRRRFQEELQHRIAQARRAGKGGALLFLDLDNFKEVNDRLGHRAGDDLLRAVVQSIQRNLRETDVLGRLGGDEFGILLFPIDTRQALSVAERVLQTIREHEVLLAGRLVRLSCSCGISLFPDHGTTVDEVLSAADSSLYMAKERGGDRVVIYAPDETCPREALADWAERLNRALREGLFVAYAQPILDLRTGCIDRWELLVRLVDRPEIVFPAAFLSKAERLGIIRAIDRWMWGQALQLIRDHNLSVHVNLSAKTLNDIETIEAIASDLDASKIPPDRLVVEITETAAIANVGKTLRCMEILRARGCRFALDDFGVGFSSLYYLKRLPADFLKIDGTFIRTLAEDGENRQIVRAIAELARGLGRETIAEWVEDEVTLRHVRDLGIDYAQGYHIGKPVPVSEIFLRRK
ncbi:MAG: EAL domain-containing protein [Armatimonadota bacterium]|nr:EAL domain-containing protein [Armatimonadota bacterium]